MKTPKMIIFDYGNTLIFEKDIKQKKAYTKLYKHITKNPDCISLDDFIKKAFCIYDNLEKNAITYDIEIPQTCFFNMLFQSFNLQIDVDYSNLKEIFWESIAPCMPMPNIEKLMDYLAVSNIRSAVISNISFSGETLKNRINRYIPKNNFEFTMASSDYGYRKPNLILFEIALKKANLNASDVWYCGDNRRADVIGSSTAGITPVLFSTPLGCPYNNDSSTIPNFEFLSITDWQELIQKLENISQS